VRRIGPTLATAVAAAAYLVWTPATADMAGHTYRAWLFSHEGLTVWNAQWYGGHHVLGYSLAFAPLSVWPGPAWAGAVAAVAAVVLFAPLARRAAPERPRAAAAATWLFALAVVCNLVIGRLPFTLGIALAVAAWAAAERPGPPWRAVTALAALGAVLASPVAGFFLAIATAARLATGRRAELRRAAVLGVPVLAGGGALALLFPEGGDDRFVASAFWPMLAVSVATLALLAPARRAWRAAGLLAVLVLAGSFLIPNSFGQNALRLPVLLGPVALLLAPRGGVPAAARAVVLGALVYLGCLPAVRAVDEARGDPSTQRSFWAAPRAFLARALPPGERVEVAFTKNHWEATYLATAVPLARGWQRQLDEQANPIFYDDRPLTRGRYHAWLRRNAVRFVVLPSAPLDYSGRQEARLIERGLPFLRLVRSGRGWRIYGVRDAEQPASDGARVTSAGPDGFDVAARGPTVVRERYTRYWHAQGGCVTPAPGGWTRVTPVRPGTVRVRARFALDPHDGCGSVAVAGREDSSTGAPKPVRGR
jgi:hypothetical protein